MLECVPRQPFGSLRACSSAWSINGRCELVIFTSITKKGELSKIQLSRRSRLLKVMSYAASIASDQKTFVEERRFGF